MTKRILASLVAGLFVAQPVMAADAPRAGKIKQEVQEKAEEGEKKESIAPYLGPLGDPGGARSALEAKGFTYRLNYTGEVFGNVSGGAKRGSTYMGKLELELGTDLEKAFGWTGGSFHASLLQIHGKGISEKFTDNLMTVSNIDASPATRLFEIWLEQKLFDNKLSIRAGQLAADSEFFVSDYSGLFINSTFGWPAIMGLDLPNGGPAYPTATPGIRVKYDVTDSASLMVGLFNGDPIGPCARDNPQYCDRRGTSFRTSDGAFVIGEGQYKYKIGDGALPGQIKLGGWYNSNRFDDQRFDNTGLSLANPDSSGDARKIRGNYGFYGILDQMVYRFGTEGDHGIGLFTRLSAAPSDRNLANFYIDGGVTVKGLFDSRPNDQFGLGIGLTSISSRVRSFDQDTGYFNEAYMPRRDFEAVLELSYKAEIVPGWTVQPDIQYIFHPQGRVLDPNDASGQKVLKNAFVIGFRTAISY